MTLISIGVPCFNEEKTVLIFYNEILKVFSDLDESLKFEIIFIDDGSKDDTFKVIKDISKKDERIKYIKFSRNFGKESAIYAGLKNSKGDYVMTMDADLQDPPALLPEMVEYIKSGYDCVATRRVTRKGEPIIRSWLSKLFYRTINKLSEVEFVDGVRDYRMMTRAMTDSVLSLTEYNRFSKGLFAWVGFETKYLEFENIEREEGETSWSFFKLVKYSIEGFVSFSTSLLSIAIVLGILFSIISMVIILFIVINDLLYSNPVPGWASTICSILFIGGVQLFCIGLLGLYISRTYLETKKRPIYISKEEKL
ncbi:MAG: glycosyltransferase family 2 protein [Methanobrevibacter sp.]|jgi:glycosyltransferase involved in cell wall biosynthesis|nr:glycosyltransferase family 2 protein [Candidatus Methanovirga procula]